jgi:DNA-directed RNA polymerase subunit RPC12/RpoP
MKTEYVCQDCNKGFQHPKNKDGMFVCPYCDSTEFTTVSV